MQGDVEFHQPVEFHRKGLANFYFVMAILFAVMGVLFLAAAFGEAVGKGANKWLGVAQWSFGGFLWLLSSPKMWTMGRAYRKNLVRFTATDVTFDTMSGQHYQIPYAAIQSIEWDSSARKRLLTIDTAETKYSFDQRSSPSIAKVAKLLQDRKIVPKLEN
jgi:hypothetical protein